MDGVDDRLAMLLYLENDPCTYHSLRSPGALCMYNGTMYTYRMYVVPGEPPTPSA